ncbi:VWA domain-containing protein [Marinobacter caseinilyticus]|uniref:VWA domain-containing protein n=1 Tax=Marinobacter caseinilyticus TaxID=2692195 RepID=UPI001F4738B0|nr:VWA domain-containing protein [Marinobacter caseinilyticus]
MTTQTTFQAATQTTIQTTARTNKTIRFCSVQMRFAVAMVLSLMMAGCGEAANYSRAAFVLVDISRDYAVELDKAKRLTHYLLTRLNSGDSLAIAFIDNSSFTERNIIAQETFDFRPSVANQQKRAFQAEMNTFVDKFRQPSYHSDITGGVLLASDYLAGMDATDKQLFILSDLHEDLPPRLKRDMAVNLKGVEVVAINVKRQVSDNNDPASYHQRLASWQQQVEQSGGRWQLVHDMAELERTVAVR